MNPLDVTFEWLLAASLRASALALAILLIRMISRRWLPAQWRYALWLPMLLVMVLPVLPSVPFGWMPKKTAEAPEMVDKQITANTVIQVADGRVDVVLPVQEPVVRNRVKVMPMIWLAGAAIFFGVGMVGYRRHMHRIIASSAAPEDELIQSLEDAAAEAGLGAVPRVLVSPVVESPAVTGAFRPCLLLPVGFPAGFNEVETRLILLHEFSHLKRRDPAVNALACMLQALHWFNPLIWFAFSCMRADREAACDARVLSIGPEDRRADYGGALLKLESTHPAYGLSLGFVGIFERTAGMKSRIREISEHRPTGFTGRVIGACFIALLVVFGATKAQQPVLPDAPLGEAKKRSKAPTAGQAAIDQKLDEIVIPRIDLENTRVDESIDFLRRRAVELDHREANGALKGVNMVVLSSEGEKPTGPAERIHFKKERISLREALGEVCRQAGMEFRVEDSAVIIFRAGESPVTVTTDAGSEVKENEAAAFAAGLILPRVRFESLTLGEMVDALNAAVKAAAKGGVVYPILLDPTTDPSVVPVREIQVRNVPLRDVLGYCTQSVGHTWTADEKAIRITARPGYVKQKVEPMPEDPAVEFASKLIVPRVEFVDVTLKEAVDFLNDAIRKGAKDGKVFPIVLAPGADPEARIREFRVSDAPVIVLLHLIGESTGHSWKSEAGTFVLRKK